jgi:hypothetical protein
MKKAILILLFVGSLGAAAQAQLLNPGINVGYGGFTSPVVDGDAKSRTQQYFSDGVQGSTTTTSSGAFHVGVNVKVWRFMVGVIGSFEQANVTNSYSYVTSPAFVKVQHEYFTVMGRVQWNWWSMPEVGLHVYGTGAIGVYTVHSKLTQDENQLNEQVGNSSNGEGLAYQVSPLGISFGKKISVYMELGYGYLGVVNGGVRFGLGK